MNILIISAYIIVTVNAVSDEIQWIQFKVNHNKTYSNLDESVRYQIFQQNLRKIEQHNEKYKNGEVSYKLGINKFADRSQEEFQKLLTLQTSPIEEMNYVVSSKTLKSSIPDKIDWRTMGAVTEVKDQGDCGGCWAFSATGSLEGQYFLKTGELLSLSEQYLIDCSKLNNNGCQSGWVMNAFRYIRDSGIVTEEFYPYEASEHDCRANATLFKDIGFRMVPQNEEELRFAVASFGPISVSIDASRMYLYSGGVFDDPDCSTTTLNHAVLVVGYGTTSDGEDYWLVKNSWGADWGNQGYLNMSRNRNNQCGIATDAMFPLL